MNNELIYTAILAASFLLLFGLAELLYHKLKVKAELTRKLVHFGTGLLTLLFPVLLDNQWFVLLLCASFALILIASLQFNKLRSINAIDRKSYGSVLYPLSVYVCYLFYNYHANKYGKTGESYIYFYLPILSLAICDPLAALSGKKFPYGKYKIWNDTKTIVGSTVFYISNLLLAVMLLFCFNTQSLTPATILLIALPIAMLGCLSEAFSGKGADNFTIPVFVLAGLILFL
jgi:dolichol kinase